MQNEEGVKVDLYIPRKCSATNRLITAKDHAAIQINIAHVDNHGIYRGEYSTFVFCGFIREEGSSDAAVTRVAQANGFLKSF